VFSSPGAPDRLSVYDQPAADRLFYRYSDNEFEYRHVQLPKAMLKAIPKAYHDSAHGTLKLLWEEEWRALGITQVGCATPNCGRHVSPKGGQPD
jgi:hypothetical protein